MSEKKIARTLKEAQVGDYVYVRLFNASGSPTKWSLAEVKYSDDKSLLCLSGNFSRDTGHLKGAYNYAKVIHAYGADSFFDQRWKDARDDILDEILAADTETLRQIAAIIGFELPPVEVEGAE